MGGPSRASSGCPPTEPRLFAAAMSKGSVRVPEFTLRPLTVPYDYRIDIMGEVPLPDAIVDILRSRLGSLIPGINGANFSLDHYGYAIEWKPRESDAHQKLLDRLESEMFQGTSGANAAMQDAMKEAVSRLGENDLGKLASLVTAADFAAVQIENDIKSRIESKLAIKKKTSPSGTSQEAQSSDWREPLWGFDSRVSSRGSCRATRVAPNWSIWSSMWRPLPSRDGPRSSTSTPGGSLSDLLSKF